MQPISAGLSNALKNQTTLTMHPYVVIEWNHNRYEDDVTVSNNGGEDNWMEDLFPIDSIIKTNRPRTGLTKALVNFARASNGSVNYYTASKDDRFKYWVSPDSGQLAAPQVVYSNDVLVNKLVVGFDLGYSRPTSVDIAVTTNGTTFVNVASGVTLDADGRAILYRSGGGWGTAENFSEDTTIRGFRVNVNGMTPANSKVHVIEMSARLVKDISDDVATVSVDKVREELNPSIPYGVAQSDMATVTLDNTTRRYDNENLGSEFAGLIQKNARVELGWAYEGHSDVVMTGEFYVQSWSYSTEDATVSMELKDYSAFIQDTKMPVVFYRNKTASYIVRDILAKIGYNDVVFNVAGEEKTIPYLWYNSDVTVWEALVDLAKSEQATFFFDRTGRFRWQDHTHLYINRTTPTWTFRANEDLVSFSKEFNVMANVVSVKYKTFTPNTKNGKPLNSVLWRADSDVVLLGDPLRSQLVDEVVIDLGRNNARLWPEKGIVNIEGEYIAYDGYWPIGSDPKSSNSADWPTGLIRTKRGILGSEKNDHYVDLNGWNKWARWDSGSEPSGTVMTLENGAMRLRNSYSSNLRDERWGVAMRGNSNSNYTVYGTKMKFLRPTSEDGGTWHTMAGMILHGGEVSETSGYYFEFISRSYADVNRPDIGNIRCYRMDNSFNRVGLPATDEGRAGYAFEIDPQRWYTVEVVNQGNDFTLYVDGIAVTSFTDSTYTGGLWGMYVRGNTDCAFEYAYVFDPTGDPDVDSQRILDRRDGAYASGYAAKERKEGVPRTNWFFDEFAPIVHEVREFDVDYQLVPALSSRPLSTNDWESNVISATGTPFSMKFTIDNASRNDATLNGQDFSISTEGPVNQYLFVYGQALIEGEEKEVIARDESSVRKNGEVELQIESTWVQTKEQAERLSEFIKDTWGEPVDVGTADVFANPALELGDLISLNYDEYNIDETEHLYYITGMRMDFDRGVGQQLTLRRVR